MYFDFLEKHYSSCVEVEHSQKVLRDVMCSVKTSLENEGKCLLMSVWGSWSEGSLQKVNAKNIWNFLYQIDRL